MAKARHVVTLLQQGRQVKKCSTNPISCSMAKARHAVTLIQQGKQVKKC